VTAAQQEWLRHITGIEERPTRLNGRVAWRVAASCSCGWHGTARDTPLAAADDSARHLLEAQS
jgi:hypothetical protein